MDKVISVVDDFSRYPAGKTRADGEFSGERFREEILVPALLDANYQSLILRLDGALYAHSWFEAVFGNLLDYVDIELVWFSLEIESENETVIYSINRLLSKAAYAKDAEEAELFPFLYGNELSEFALN